MHFATRRTAFRHERCTARTTHGFSAWSAIGTSSRPATIARPNGRRVPAHSKAASAEAAKRMEAGTTQYVRCTCSLNTFRKGKNVSRKKKPRKAACGQGSNGWRCCHAAQIHARNRDREQRGRQDAHKVQENAPVQANKQFPGPAAPTAPVRQPASHLLPQTARA